MLHQFGMLAAKILRVNRHHYNKKGMKSMDKFSYPCESSKNVLPFKHNRPE